MGSLNALGEFAYRLFSVGRNVRAYRLRIDQEQVERCVEVVEKIDDPRTPATIADQLVRHLEGRSVKHWDADVMYRRLRDLGFGLLVVEGQQVYEFIECRENDPTDKKFEEVYEPARDLLYKLRRIQGAFDRFTVRNASR